MKVPMKAVSCAGLLILMLFTGMSGGQGKGGVFMEPMPPPVDFHTAHVTVNLTYENGTPAEGLSVVYKNKDRHYSTSTFSNSSGQADFDIYGKDWGIGTIRAKEGVYYQCYEEFFVGPDDDIYLDIVVDDEPAPVNTITGTVRNASSGEVVEGIKVYAIFDDVYTNYRHLSDTTDPSGVYSIDLQNTTTPIRIQVDFLFDKEFFDHTSVVLMYDPPTTITHDIYLLPTLVDGNHFSLGIKNSTSGEWITEGEVDVNGYWKDYAHDSASVDNVGVSGDRFEVELCEGEYEFEWESGKDTDWNVTYYASGYFLMNDTEESIDIDIPVPEYTHAYIEVWNDTDPLMYAYAEYEHEHSTPQGEFEIDGYIYTDTYGKLHMGIPIGWETELRIYKSGYEDKYIYLDPKNTDPIIMNLTLEKKGTSEIPKGDVTIVVKDRETDIPLPEASISGSGYYNGEYVNIGNLKTNDTGVFEGQISIGEYDYLSASHPMGGGRIGDITISETNPEIVIYLDRYIYYGDRVDCHITVKDPSGTLRPDVTLSIYENEGYPGAYSYRLTSDESGMIRFRGYPGIQYNVYSSEDYTRDYRPLWAADYTEFVVPPAGGYLGDVMVYRAEPLSIIRGFVRDGVTGDPLPQVGISAYSMHLMDPAYNPFLSEFWDGGVYLYDQYGKGSDEDGYYRVRGTDRVFVSAWADGYLPTLIKHDLNTRVDIEEDILLDPVPEEMFWVNGTVIDQYGEPVDSGWVTIADSDRGGIPTYQWADMEEDNTFSLYVWEGNFSLFFENRTMHEFMDIQVTGDQEGVVFQVLPEFRMGGVVTDWEGTPLEGINVTLTLTGEEDELIGWTLTNGTGHYLFEELNMGDYIISTDITQLHDPFESDPIPTSGWDDVVYDIMLENRSVADLMGSVIGEAGHLTGGVPGSAVEVWQDGARLFNTTADAKGDYLIPDVPHAANYTVRAVPSITNQPVVDLKPGYTENLTVNVSVSGYETVLDIHLPYVEYSPPGYLNITEVLPTGENVPLDEPIVVSFDLSVNATSFQSAFYATPAITRLNFSWNWDLTTVVISHDLLEANTTYEVSVGASVVSAEGWPLWKLTGRSWSFTTGMEEASWRITWADVYPNADRSINVLAKGKENMTVYLVVDDPDDGMWSFLIPEVSNGTYQSLIAGDQFEWEAIYNVHFSDTENGSDLAPAWSGEIEMPENPDKPPEWSIISALVVIDDDGDWLVTVNAPLNQTIWIVITGEGDFNKSFNLTEDPPGTYTTVIKADQFEWEKNYTYHFSDTEGGSDKAPTWSGSDSMPREPKGEDEDDNLGLCIGLAIIILLIVLVIVILIVIVAKKGSKEEGFEDEDEDEDEEDFEDEDEDDYDE